MHVPEGYGSRSRCLSVCLSVTAFLAILFISMLKTIVSFAQYSLDFYKCDFSFKSFVHELWLRPPVVLQLASA